MFSNYFANDPVEPDMPDPHKGTSAMELTIQSEADSNDKITLFGKDNAIIIRYKELEII